MDLGILELSGRLLLAAVLGGIVGIESDWVARGAGARTHALVSLGAALFTVAGAYGFADVETATNADPARVAAQVATGVGFIGAGAIIRNGASVVGVTTAATVWLAASTGVVAAAGGYVAALVTTAFALVVLVAMRAARPLMQRLGRSRGIVEVHYERGHGTLGPLLRHLTDVNGRVEQIELEDDDASADGEGLRRATLHVSVQNVEDLDSVLGDVGRRPEVRSLSVNTGEAE